MLARAEFGIVFAQGVHRLRREMPFVLEDATNGLSALSRELFFELHQELIFLDRRVEALESRIRLSFASSEACQRIGKVEGIGPMTATALVAAIGDATAFNNGRELAAWLGLVPKQHSTGGRPRLLGISKRGDRYVRMLLIHGARSVLYRAQSKTDKRSHWLNAVRARRGNNIASVALANKNARIAWALLARETNYRAAA